MTEKVNVKIKAFLGPKGKYIAATPKVFIRDGGQLAKGCRALEPGEVVTLDRAEAVNLLRACGDVLEITLEAANRPLYFSNEDEAYMTSQYYNPSTAGRAEEAKQLMAEIQKKLAEEAEEEAKNSSPPVNAPVDPPVADPPEPDPMIQQIDEELEDYEPTINAHHIKEIKEEREKAAEAEQPARRRRRR